MLEPLSLASHGPVIPVIVIQRVEDAVPLAEALVAGGIKVLEVTLRTPVALKAMEAMARVPGAIVGAGTLRTPADVKAAKHAGCQFGVSPGFTNMLASACHAEGLPLLPGVSTASEIMVANQAGFNFLKLFPAAAVGGVNLLKSLAGPFPDVSFCPTGGISLSTAPGYLQLPNVKVCGGSWLTPQDAIDAKDWARITRLAAEAMALA
jgi:2-dehydro-3-deoxyphosphogluconate aldolase/(4S)-4-hydroxy-2-oxoglutarate aldolase